MKSNAQKQADYRARMAAEHARVIVYLPRATMPKVADLCIRYGLTMSEVVTLALDRLSDAGQSVHTVRGRK